MFESANEFSTHIEKLSLNEKLTYTEAVVKYCQEHFLDVEEIAPLISKSLKEKLAVEFRAVGLLPKQSTLDCD